MITNFLSSEGGLKSGGTISGDVTISGDLTVNGNGSGNYDEIVNGNLIVSSGNKLGVGLKHPTLFCTFMEHQMVMGISKYQMATQAKVAQMVQGLDLVVE